MATLYSPKIVTDGLLLYLDAANQKSYSGGATWRDAAGQSTDITLYNSPTFSSSNNGILSFATSSSQYGDGNIVNLGTGNVAITIDFWFKAISHGAEDYIMVIGADTNFPPTGTWEFFMTESSGKIFTFFQLRNQRALNIILNYGEWINATATLTAAGDIKFYINGIMVDSGSGASSSLTSNYIKIGRAGGTLFNYYLNGSLGPIKIYNRAILEAEVLQNYNAVKGRFL
jgi:hypothetical protein